MALYKKSPVTSVTSIIVPKLLFSLPRKRSIFAPSGGPAVGEAPDAKVSVFPDGSYLPIVRRNMRRF